MISILEKLFKGKSEQASEQIVSQYQKNWFTIVNFIYFAVVSAQKVFGSHGKTARQKEYKKIILKSDFLLPDGIALQIFYFFARIFRRVKWRTYRLDNLNWTDFTRYFLEYIKTKFGNQKICLLMFGTEPAFLEKAKDYISYRWYNVIYTQDGFSTFNNKKWFSELNRQKVKEALAWYQDTINILLVAMSTAKSPRQELWTADNLQEIKDHNLIVINTWWTFEWWAWTQKRSPKVIRAIKLGRLRRFIADPKRNYMKVYHSLSLFKYIFKYLLLKKD
jgi:UDP-N-acetyl-D-mannosaminuronic acid transferase (WecB/TagA/CpsF family)